jgi:hypothetical protein
MQPGQDDPYNPQQPPQDPGAYQPPPPPGSYPPPGNYPPPGSYPPPGTPPGAYPPPGYGPAPSNGQGVAALVLGIISIPLACCGYGGILFGILGMVFGFLGRKKADQGLATNRGQAQAGLICGAVGLVLGIAVLILSFAFRSFDWQHYIDTHSTT